MYNATSERDSINDATRGGRAMGVVRGRAEREAEPVQKVDEDEYVLNGFACYS